MNYKTIGLFLIIAAGVAFYPEKEETIEAEPIPVITIPEEILPEPPTLVPELVKICTCESGQGTGKPQQFNIHTGEVLRGEINSDDTGMCQINTYYHLETAVAMGMDIETEEGNILYSNWLYSKQGSRPWNWSKPCWGTPQ
jgi:hypothetical protein